MSAPKGNALIGQSGGPTHVINQSLVGVVETALESPSIGKVYGALHGFKGVLEEHLIDLGAESRETLEAVAQVPGAALRSVRKKPTVEECARAFEVLKRHDIRYFFYIGGNDSAETAHILSEMAAREGHELVLYHVPKTIDNDLRATDFCPGYPSAARYVSLCFLGDNVDVRSLPGIKLNVVMGRNAGWLTAASALARQHLDDGPHLVYLPEIAFDPEEFVASVDAVNQRLGRCIVAVSEGIHDAAGKLYAESKETDSHGNVQLSGSGALGDKLAGLLKARLGDKLRVRADTFGYAQRSYFGAASAVDSAAAREVGRVAARLATSGGAPTGTISIRREAGSPYRANYVRSELSAVAKVTRPMEAELLSGLHDVSPAFLDYLRPLVGELPRAARLSDIAVPKR